MKNAKTLILLVFSIFLLISMFVNIAIGAFDIAFIDIFKTISNPQENIIYLNVLTDIRIPRVVLAMLVGASFGVCGALMQTLFKNPLADPSLIGIASGASAGVVIFMLLGSLMPAILYNGTLSFISLPLSAFLGAIFTIILIYKLSTIYNKVSVSIMLLSGIAVNAVFGALVGLFTYLSTEEELKSFTFWTMGSLADADLKSISIMLPVAIVCCVFALTRTNELNLLLLGEDESKNAGVNSERLKKLIIIFVSLAIGASVSCCGIIGFIGLVVPHISRLVVGSNHKYYIPLSCLLGSLVLLWSDSIARVIMSPAELPIGIITALFGAPFFMWLLIKNRQSSII